MHSAKLGVDVIEGRLPPSLRLAIFESGADDCARRSHGSGKFGRPGSMQRAGTSIVLPRPSKMRLVPPHPRYFLATSAIHREFKLQMTPRKKSSRRAVEGVTRGEKVASTTWSFSPGKTLLVPSSISWPRVVGKRVISAGATTVNIPDTVGYAVPQHYAARDPSPQASMLRNIEDAVISVHCHNDLGIGGGPIGLSACARRCEANRVYDQLESGERGGQLCP